MDEHAIMHMEDVTRALKRYTYEIDAEKSDSKKLTVRLPFISEEEVEEFRKIFSEATKTGWILYNNNSKRTKCYHKVWICHLSGYRKIESSKKNANCTAKLDIKIKNLTQDSVAKDRYLIHDPPLRTVATISIGHNHTINSAAALNLLKVSDEVKFKFFGYFEGGITPGEAISLHEDELLASSNCDILSDASKNPTKRQVYHLHEQWRTNQFGPCLNPFIKLKERIPNYEEEGTSVKLVEGDLWAVAVVTSIMKRAQNLRSSKELIFVDSSSSCENSSSSVTVLLTASNTGALPLAVLIHKNQTAENYATAFRLLKDNFSECFGKENRQIFMTDDSAAEKKALKEVWPNSNQLLCHFHVAQAEWRWLFSQQSIPANERPRLMKLFQNVMYADSECSLNLAVANILKESNYPDFIARFTSYFSRKMEWVTYCRRDLIIRGNNTNNYAEATIRILKDVVLCRTKAYNLVALVHYIANTWENYLKKKLMQFAYGRSSKPYLLYTSLLKRTGNYQKENIIQVEANVFLIQSSLDNISYTVSTNIGTCTCYSGRTGAFCKHQCFLMETEGIRLPNMLPITSAERFLLGKLALGDKCPEYTFFQDLIPCENLNIFEDSSITPEPEHKQELRERNDSLNKSPDPERNDTNEENRYQMYHNLIKEFDRVRALVDPDMDPEVSENLLKTLKNIKHTEDFANFSSVKKHYKTKKIKVQPTSISRRREGSTKRSKRVPAGRPLMEKKAKRRRCLVENIMNNIRNAR